MNILAGVRVVDCSSGIAGPYAAKLFADAGAEVIRAGASLDDTPLSRYLAAGKVTVAFSEDLLAGADLVVLSDDDLSPDSVERMRRCHPHLVVVTVTPWGLRGPWVGRPATEFTVQAEAGVIAVHGRADEEPYQTGGRLPEWCAGVAAAVGALGALVTQRGVGRHVDVSLQAVAAHTGIAFLDVRDRVEGTSVGQHPPRVIDAPSIESTADGFVGFAAHTPDQIRAFLTLIERPDLLGSDWEKLPHRLAHLDEWNAIVANWTRGRKTTDVVAAAAALRIPAAPVLGPQAVLDHEQIVARDLIVDAPDGSYRHPAGPYLIDGERPRVPHDVEAGQRWAPRTARIADDRPLVGFRVLDCTAVFAGPSAAQVLCYLGAEVIHVESPDRIDTGRSIVGSAMGAERWWERAGMFLSNNRDKLGLAVSLNPEEGRALVRRLVETSDVVLENFAPRVFERFGLDHDGVRTLNPRAVFARMPAFGLSGPWRDHLGYAQTMEQVTGMAWRTGRPDNPPRAPRGPCDPLTGYHAVFAVLLGLARRERTGDGAAVEAAMLDASLNAAAELIVQYTASGTVLERDGNRSADAAPQGIYRCPGDEQWLAVSVADDEQWQALRRLLGLPDEPAWRSLAGRRAAHDALDRALAAWSLEHDLDRAVALLIEAGVPAGAVRDPRLLSEHPQLRAFGYYESSDHPVVGRQWIPALPLRFDDVERWSSGRAPLLGEHNEAILCGRLALAADEYRTLAETGVIGNEPAGAR